MKGQKGKTTTPRVPALAPTRQDDYLESYFTEQAPQVYTFPLVRWALRRQPPSRIGKMTFREF